jgi:hypothetical protein
VVDYNALIGDKSTVGSIKSWVNYNEIQSIEVLGDAQAWIYQRLRITEMQTLKVYDAAPLTSQLALPPRHLDPITMVVQKPRSVITNRLPQDLLGIRVYDEASPPALLQSMPTDYTVFDNVIQFNVACDLEYFIEYLYYQSLPLLSGGAATNVLTDRYPSLLRYTCAGMAADFMNDDAAATKWLGKAEALIEDIGVQDDLSLRGVVL